MNVKELIEELQKYPDYTPVYLESFFPDYTSGAMSSDLFEIDNLRVISNTAPGNIVVISQREIE